MTGFISINPYTGEHNSTYHFIGNDELREKIDIARQAYYAVWKELTVNARANKIKPIAAYLRENAESLALTITLEMGKPIRESLAEVEKVAWLIEYHCDNASEFLKTKYIDTNYSASYISYEPLGGIFGIMPWNFPYWQVFRFAIPTLLAGNVVLLKHAPNVPLCALKIAEIFSDFLGDRRIYQNLFIDVSQVETVIADPFIQGVSLTGSEKAGSAVGALAGKHIKKMVLELGGTDPFVICSDADISTAINQFMISRMSNNGQICIAAKRLIVNADVYDQVKKILIEKISDLRSGDPRDSTTQISCMARPDLKKTLNDQIAGLKLKGAVSIYGDNDETLTVCSAQILEISIEALKNFDEEIFGPVALLTSFETIDEVPDIINSSRYGLAACVWTKDINNINGLLRNIETGNISVNKMVASDPRIPFGGIKKSGYGKEMAEAGIKEFVNAKSIVIN